MLTRRGFASVASCAICSVAGFAASEAFAQGSAATTANGVTRKVLSRTDGPAAGYETIIMDVTLDPGASVARHTHPGIESTYVMEGEIELPIQGRPTQMLKAGEAFQVPPETRMLAASRRRPRRGCWSITLLKEVSRSQPRRKKLVQRGRAVCGLFYFKGCSI